LQNLPDHPGFTPNQELHWFIAVDNHSGLAVVQYTRLAGLAPVAHFSQRDPRWAAQRLGNAGTSTIGSHGCAITALASVLSQYYPTITPAEVNTYLQANGGYSGNELLWAALPGLYQQLNSVERYDWDRRLTAAEVAMVNQRLQQVCIGEVDFYPKTATQEMHFVVLLGRTTTNGIADYVILDPWDGSVSTLLLRYGDTNADGIPDWDIARALYGIRVLNFK